MEKYKWQLIMADEFYEVLATYINKKKVRGTMSMVEQDRTINFYRTQK